MRRNQANAVRLEMISTVTRLLDWKLKVTYPGSHVAKYIAEEWEDVILQHEFHLVFVNFFLCREV